MWPGPWPNQSRCTWLSLRLQRTPALGWKPHPGAHPHRRPHGSGHHREGPRTCLDPELSWHWLPWSGRRQPDLSSLGPCHSALSDHFNSAPQHSRLRGTCPVLETQVAFWLKTTQSLGKADFVSMPLPDPQSPAPRASSSFRKGGVSSLGSRAGGGTTVQDRRPQSFRAQPNLARNNCVLILNNPGCIKQAPPPLPSANTDSQALHTTTLAW